MLRSPHQVSYHSFNASSNAYHCLTPRTDWFNGMSHRLANNKDAVFLFIFWFPTKTSYFVLFVGTKLAQDVVALLIPYLWFLNLRFPFGGFQVQRPPGPPYTAHEISKGHPNLAATPPGHASSPGLSQVSVSTVSTAHLYGHPKAWEAGGGVSAPM